MKKRCDSMKKKSSLIIGIILLIAAIRFIGYALAHPEASFPWSNRVSFMLYGIYIWMMFKFLLDIPVLRAIRDKKSKGGIINAIIFFVLSLGFFLMEITGDKVDIYTIIRGFIVVGGIDLGTENFLLWIRKKA